MLKAQFPREFEVNLFVAFYMIYVYLPACTNGVWSFRMKLSRHETEPDRFAFESSANWEKMGYPMYM